jgi:DNA-binding LytR/AlgR family response regulator
MVSMSINYNHYLRSRMEELLDKTTEEQQNITVTIHDSSVRGNDLTLPINNLLYMEAQKNNVIVYYTDQGKTVAKELHATLTSVLADLQDYENIFQCHRSFVVNLNNITSAKGNSNGYQLMLGKCTTAVPVSRTYVPRLKSFIA